MSSNLINENTNNKIGVKNRLRCSFCECCEHNISACNDRRLLQFEGLCLTRYMNLGYDGFMDLLMYLSEDQPKIVKSYAIRYCGCAIKSNILQCLNKIRIKIIELHRNNVIIRGLINTNYNIKRNLNIQKKIVESNDKNYCECKICYDSIIKSDFIELNCGHSFCKDCVKKSLQNIITEKPCCALCRAELIAIQASSEKIVVEVLSL